METNEAFDTLARTKSWYIAMARYVAAQIVLGKEPWVTLAAHGPSGAPLLPEKNTVHSYAVRIAMKKAGFLDGYSGTLHFLGVALAKGGGFLEASSKSFSYTHQDDGEDAGRAVHERTVKVWRVKPGGAILAVPEPKMPDDIVERIEGARKREAETLALREAALREKR